jgi:hypothetical protein
MTIIEELKQTAVDGDAPYERAMSAKAVAEIERLELENVRLKILLAKCHSIMDAIRWDSDSLPGILQDFERSGLLIASREAYLKALQDKLRELQPEMPRKPE